MIKRIKMESINHYEPRSFIQENDESSMTDQSYEKDQDINLIVARYRKTSVLPEMRTQTIAQYFDTTQVPSFQDAKNRIAQANSMFAQLPAALRERLGNKPENAEGFFNDPRNAEYLEQFGFISRDIATPTPETQNKPSQASTEPISKAQQDAKV